MYVCAYTHIHTHKHTHTHTHTHTHAHTQAHTQAHTHTHTHTHTRPTPYRYASHWLIVFMTRGTCTCAQACTVRAYPEREREPRCTRACARRICMGHIHGHADGHSGHVLVECVRADCLLVSCSGSSTCAATRSACFRRASLTSSRRLGE